MQATLTRWAFTLAALFIAGPLARAVVRSVEASDGGQSLVMLNGVNGVLAVVVTLALATLLGVGAARVVHVRHGLFCAGLVFAWAGWAAGDMLSWVQRLRGAASFMQLMPDALVLSGAGAALAWGVAAVARKEPAPEAGAPPAPPSPLASMPTLTAVVVGAIGAFLAASVVAQGPSEGQAFAAAAFAGLAAGVSARAVAYTARPQACVWGVLALGVVTPIAAGLTTDMMVADIFDRDVIAIAWVTPWMWLAGAFVGTPFGMAWAESMVRQTTPSRAGEATGPRIKRATP